MNYCSPLSDMIVVLLSQTLLLFSSPDLTTIMSERGEQLSFLKEENNNHVRKENNNHV
jgi:cellobiose phosphorylase